MKRRVDRLLKAAIALNVVAIVVVVLAIIVIGLPSVHGGPSRAVRGPAVGIARGAHADGAGPHPDGQQLPALPRDGRRGRRQADPGHGPSPRGLAAIASSATRTIASARRRPGHQGIPQRECLNCHKVAPDGPAITQPHSTLQDQHVPRLPRRRRPPAVEHGRQNQDECWLCHKPTASPPPQKPHPDTAAPHLPELPLVARGRAAARSTTRSATTRPASSATTSPRATRASIRRSRRRPLGHPVADPVDRRPVTRSLREPRSVIVGRHGGDGRLECRA